MMMSNRQTFLAVLMFIVSFLIVFTGNCNSEVDRIYTIKTELGIVQAIPGTTGLPPNTITVNGKKVFQSKEDYAFLYGSFRTPNYTAVLFGENAGGSATPVDTLYFLLLRSNREPTIVANKDFYSADGTMHIQQRKDDVVIDLGFEAKKRKTAVLQAGKIVVRHATVNVSPMKIEDCKQVYEYASGECLQLRDLKFDCEHYGRHYMGNSGNSMGFIRGVSNRPGFVDSALGAICVTTCKTGTMVSFEQFKKDVCSIK
jgi:hypothetical protein